MRFGALAFAASLLASAAEAQLAGLENARVETRAVTAGLDRELRALVAAQSRPA